MRKVKTVIGILGIVTLGCCALSAMAAQNDFPGVWTLDKAKTRGLPKQYKGQTMVVTQNAQELVVETRLESGLQGPQSQESVESASPHATGRGGGGYVNTISSTSGYSAGSLALTIVSPRVTYSLDGKETTADWGALQGISAKVKAKRSKDGKALELSIVQQESSGAHRTMLTSKERWTLSEDGKELKVQRSVSTPQGSDAILLIFQRGQDKPPAAQ